MQTVTVTAEFISINRNDCSKPISIHKRNAFIPTRMATIQQYNE